MIYVLALAAVCPLFLVVVALLSQGAPRAWREAPADRLRVLARGGRITIEHRDAVQPATRRAALRGVVGELSLLLRAARVAATWQRAAVSREVRVGDRALLALLRMFPGAMAIVLAHAPSGWASKWLCRVEASLLRELSEAFRELPDGIAEATRNRVARSRTRRDDARDRERVA